MPNKSVNTIPQIKSNVNRGMNTGAGFILAIWNIALTAISITALVFSIQNVHIAPIVGPEGPPGHCLGNCTDGQTGPQGPRGLPGINGTNGMDGTNCLCDGTSFANFYSLQPSDNANLLAPGQGINFTNAGPSRGTGIQRVNTNTFLIIQPGAYRFSFFASISEAAQIQLYVIGLGGTPCIAGRTAGLTMISFDCLYSISTPSTQVQVVNPAGEIGSVTLTPSAGGSYSMSTHFTIVQL